MEGSMKMNSLRLFLVATTVLFAGCSDPKAASNKNFAKAASAHLLVVERSGAFYIGSKAYPASEKDDTNAKALAQIGFLKITGHESFSMATWDIYDLTSKGREFFAPGRGFCFGKPELISITNFTEPGSTGPYVMSRVTYSYRVIDAPSWVSDWNSQNAEKIPTPNAQFQDTQTFVLTANGWVHESLAR
jgi:hypothetical protein